MSLFVNLNLAQSAKCLKNQTLKKSTILFKYTQGVGEKKYLYTIMRWGGLDWLKNHFFFYFFFINVFTFFQLGGGPFQTYTQKSTCIF